MASGSIAKAYVQVIPSAQGISSKLTGIFSKEGSSAGSSFGNSLVGKVGNIIAAAGIGKALGETLTAGGDLQQSLGGIETLFKDSADIVIANANNAYKTAGMSANSYMEMVTGFSASLLQGLGGDTQKAADIADMALTDMSDNANKMGTSMELIQNAYQGFAKQNYTMLDNLKLGYGGTKTEMQRLLADAQKLTGVKYDIRNLADVYEAIHVIQEEMGITGTTAKEAASTFSGSLASMKASFKDLLANMATGRDISASLNAIKETTYTFFVGNLIPMVRDTLSSLPQVVETGISMAIDGMNLAGDNAEKIVQFGLDLVTGIGTAIITAIPNLAEAAVGIAAGLGNALINTDWIPIGQDLLNALRESINLAAAEILGTDSGIVGYILAAIWLHLPQVVDSGMQIVTNIANGLYQNMPYVLSIAGEIMQAVLLVVVSLLPDFLSAGVSFVTEMTNGLLDNLPLLLETAGQLMQQLLEAILKVLPEVLSAGVSLIAELVTGLFQKGPEVLTTIGQILGEMVAAIVSYLPQLLEQGSALIWSLISGAVACIPAIVEAAFNLIDAFFDAFSNTDWTALGDAIIDGIYNGITSGVGVIIDAARNVARNALNAAKRFLGIASPSKVMRDQIGKFIPEGMAVGIKANTKPLTDAMHGLSDLTTKSLQSDLRISSRTNVVPSRQSIGPKSYTFYIYAAEGQDVEEIAQAVKEIIQNDIEKEEASVA